MYTGREMKRISIILPANKFQYRQILTGILEGSRTRDTWQLSLELGDHSHTIVGSSHGCRYDGIIAMGVTATRRDELLAQRTPIVFINPPTNVDGVLPPPPRWATYLFRDHVDVGRIAADYFLNLGYTSFAFVGTATPTVWCERRLVGFRMRLGEVGRSCAVFMPPKVRRSRSSDAQELRTWLQKLPPGTALYASEDERALQTLNLCVNAGIAVPDTLAILGNDNDEILCASSTPPLSSIDFNCASYGLKCTRLLKRLMEHRRPKSKVPLPRPQIITRQSTNASLISDPFLAKALNIVRENPAIYHTVNGLADTLGVSRRMLEIKARRVLGTTLKSEIDNIRLKEAMRLIVGTQIAVQEIADRCGFCSASHLGVRIKAVFGRRISEFRS